MRSTGWQSSPIRSWLWLGTKEIRMSETGEKKSSPLAIAAAWLLVAIPAIWGLSFTIQNAMKLFVASGPGAH